MPEPDAESLAPEISAEAFARIRTIEQQNPANEPCILLDVREPWEFESASLAGAVQMPMGDVPSRAHAELDPDAHIVVLCHHGARSLSVAIWLRAQGFEYAQSLAGGIDGWSRTMDPAIPRY